MQQQRRASSPAVGGEAVGNRTDDQPVGSAHRDKLAELPVRPTEVKLGVTANSTGDPEEEGGGREEDLKPQTSSGHLNLFSEGGWNKPVHLTNHGRFHHYSFITQTSSC